MTVLKAKPKRQRWQWDRNWEPARVEWSFLDELDEKPKREQQQQLADGMARLLARKRADELGPVWAALRARWTA